MRLRRLALPAISLALVAGLTACDDYSPTVDITLVVHNNGDGTTTVSGTAYDRDQPTAALVIEVSVVDGVVATVTADEDRPGFAGVTGDRRRVDTGTRHGFTATFPTPRDPEAPVCVWTHGLGQGGIESHTGQPHMAEKHTTVCAKAKEVEKLTGSTTTSTSTTTVPGVTTTTEATTTTVAPTSTTSTTSTTMFMPTSTTSTTLPGPPPMCPDPMDPMGPLIPC